MAKRHRLSETVERSAQELLEMIEYLASGGSGVTWSPLFGRYWPIRMVDGRPVFWTNSHGCCDRQFKEAVVKTFALMKDADEQAR